MPKAIQNYVLYECIGSNVYRAVNKNDNLEYAVKVVSVSKLDKKQEAGIVNEINILNSIEENQHIIRYIDMMKTPNNFYFIYEYCNEGSLEKMLAKENKLSETKAMKIFQSLLKALKVLNKYGIIHGDICPKNVMFKNGVLKLRGFNSTELGQKAFSKTMMGQPLYKSPEALKGEAYSTKADIWSLGVILYEMLAGFCPFESKNISQLMLQMQASEINFQQQWFKSEQIRQALIKMLDKIAEKRIGLEQLLTLNLFEEKLSPMKGERIEIDTDKMNFQVFEKKIDFSSQKKEKEHISMKVTELEGEQESKKSEQNLQIKLRSQQNFSNLSSLQNLYQNGKQVIIKSQSHESQKAAAKATQSRLKVLNSYTYSTQGLQIAFSISQSKDSHSTLFAYLILKKTQSKLFDLRKQIQNIISFNELLTLVSCSLEEIQKELKNYSLNTDSRNWKALVKATGWFHPNFLSFYQTVAYLSDQMPRQDLPYIQMQRSVEEMLRRLDD